MKQRLNGNIFSDYKSIDTDTKKSELKIITHSFSFAKLIFERCFYVTYPQKPGRLERCASKLFL